MIGRTIGRYRVLSLLGRGGMGDVWKAEDALLGRFVAIKFLPEDATPLDRERFLRGARLASSLQHPGIATVYEAGESDGRTFCALAFVDGETIADLVALGPVAFPDAARIAVEAAEALQHAHAHEVIHRDVSSRNIMVARDGRAVVVDFGLAWRAGSTEVTRGSTRPATLDFLAPELVLDGPASPGSDLYALGVVLYHMLTGSLPFGADREQAVRYRILHEPPEPPSHRRPGVPSALEQAVLAMLEKDPARRPVDAKGLAARLRATVSGPLAQTDADGVTADDASHRAPVSRGLRLPEEKYLAVLPFRAQGAASEPSDEHARLALGFAEAVCTGLQGMPGLRVFPPAALGADGLGLDAREAASRLGANLVLDGTVRVASGQVRLAYRLVLPGTGMLYTGGALDGSLATLLDLEDALIAALRTALDPVITPAPRRAAVRDPAAHERYLQALGYLLRHENEASVDGAIGLLRRLVESDPEVARYHATLGRAYLHKHQLTAQARWLAHATAACERAMALEARAPEALVTLAEVFTVTGQADRALATYETLLDTQGENIEVLIGMCRALEAAGRFEEAEAAVRRAIAMRPDDWRTYSRLGNLHFHQSRYDDAIEAWREVTRLTPDNARGWYNLGAGYFERGDMEESLRSYDRAISILPTARAYASLGTVHFYSGRHEDAVVAFRKALALTPGDPMVWGNLGSACSFIASRRQEAAESLDRAITLMRDRLQDQRSDAEGWAYMAQWLGHRGRIAEAQEAIGHALRLAPANARVLVQDAYVRHLSGNHDQAIECLREAVARGLDAKRLLREPILGPIAARAGLQPLVAAGSSVKESPVIRDTQSGGA